MSSESPLKTGSSMNLDSSLVTGLLCSSCCVILLPLRFHADDIAIRVKGDAGGSIGPPALCFSGRAP